MARSALVLLSARGGGDRPPVVALAVGLRQLGWDITVLCDQESADLTQSTGLETIVFDASLNQRGAIRDWSKTVRATDPPQAKGVPNPLDIWAEKLLPRGEEVIAKTKPDMIIAALFTMGLAEGLSQRTGTPWCHINPSFYFGENQPRPWEEDWYPPVIPLFAEYVLNPLAQKAPLTLHATDEVMDLNPEPLPPNHHYVGFLLWEPPADIPKNIQAAERPWRLITTSTEPQREEIHLVQSAVEALAGLPGTTILTIPNPDLRAELVGLPTNTLTAGFVPHTPIIQNSELVVSHAGHGIVSKCLQYGAPMLMLPWDRDQPGVAVRAARLGSAIMIERENVDPENVRAAAQALIHDETYQTKAQEHAQRLQQHNAIQIAVGYLEKLLA